MANFKGTVNVILSDSAFIKRHPYSQWNPLNIFDWTKMMDLSLYLWVISVLLFILILYNCSSGFQIEKRPYLSHCCPDKGLNVTVVNRTLQVNKRSVTWNYFLTPQFMKVNNDNYISLSYDSFIFCKFPSPPCLMFTIKIYQIFESLQYIQFPNLYDNICNFTSKRYTWWCMNRPIYASSFNNITVSWCVSKKFTKPKVCCQSPGSFVSCTRPHLLWLWCRNFIFL